MGVWAIDDDSFLSSKTSWDTSQRQLRCKRALALSLCLHATSITINFSRCPEVAHSEKAFHVALHTIYLGRWTFQKEVNWMARFIAPRETFLVVIFIKNCYATTPTSNKLILDVCIVYTMIKSVLRRANGSCIAVSFIFPKRIKIYTAGWKPSHTNQRCYNRVPNEGNPTDSWNQHSYLKHCSQLLQEELYMKISGAFQSAIFV